MGLPEERHSLSLDDRMEPGVRLFSRIEVEPASAGEFRPGDLVAYYDEAHLLRVSRVVRIRPSAKGAVLLTKGDNRFHPDSALSPDRVEGRVTRAGRRDLTAWHWRLLGRWMAWLSYLPSAGLSRIIGRLPRGRALASRLAPALHPLLLYNGLLRRIAGRRIGSGQRTPDLLFRSFRDTDLEEVVALWNACFPGKPMDPSRFRAKICGSPWFSPEGLWLAARGSRIVAFVLASERRYRCGERPSPGTGFIECLGVEPGERRRGIGSRLVLHALRWLRQRGCANFRTGRFPVERDDRGRFIPAPALHFLERLGFRVSEFGRQILFTPEVWDPAITKSWLRRMEASATVVRQAAPEDLAALEEAIRGWGQRWHYPDGFGPGGAAAAASSYVLGVREGRILGYCRTLLHDEVDSYDQFDWIWDAAAEDRGASAGFLYVDPRHRAFGLGAALIAKGLDLLFERGCRGIWGNTPLPALQGRYARWKGRVVAGVAMMSRGGFE